MVDEGFQLLQARPLRVDVQTIPDTALWRRHPGLTGQPSGFGWGVGRACVVRGEGDLARVGYGDVLVTTVAGPALSIVLPRVSAVVAERRGSTSHLAALARERGIPAVLGVADATRRLSDGCWLLVDGVTGAIHERASGRVARIARRGGARRGGPGRAPPR